VEAYDGPQIVGMDLHHRRSVLVRMTEDGRKLGTARITNSPARLAAEIRRVGLHPQVVLEACHGWYWAADALSAADAELHLAHPAGSEGLQLPPGRLPCRSSTSGRDLCDLPQRTHRFLLGLFHRSVQVTGPVFLKPCRPAGPAGHRTKHGDKRAVEVLRCH